jgi:hypothetical protein
MNKKEKLMDLCAIMASGAMVMQEWLEPKPQIGVLPAVRPELSNRLVVLLPYNWQELELSKWAKEEIERMKKVGMYDALKKDMLSIEEGDD